MSSRQTLNQFLAEARAELERQAAELDAFATFQKEGRKAGIVGDNATREQWEAALELYLSLRRERRKANG